jgi:maleate isomerase
MTPRVRLGMLTPSSNTVLEPVTSAMVAGLGGVTAHFGRFPVTEISLGEHALGQFQYTPMLAAARLLADARVDVICWNGTSAGWLGLDTDRRLCEAITAETGVPAVSSVLALADVFRLIGVTRYGLVTPYLDEIQARIVDTFRGEGFACAAERHLGDKGNFSFAEVSDDTLATMIREVAASGVPAITIFCTNLRGAPLVPALEAELGVPIYDTVSTAVWASLRATGVDPARVRGWGRLFEDPATARLPARA